MRVGVVNTNGNNPYLSKQNVNSQHTNYLTKANSSEGHGIYAFSNNNKNISFQAISDESVKTFMDALKALEQKKTSPEKLKTILKKVFSLSSDINFQERETNETDELKTILIKILDSISDTDLRLQEAKARFRFDKIEKRLTTALKSTDTDKQTKAIKTISQYYAFPSAKDSYRNVANEYIWNTMIPVLKESKNRALADLFLDLTTNDYTKNPDADLIYQRIKHIEVIGSEKHIKELREYATKPAFNNVCVLNSTPTPSFLHIKDLAKEVIEKLS